MLSLSKSQLYTYGVHKTLHYIMTGVSQLVITSTYLFLVLNVHASSKLQHIQFSLRRLNQHRVKSAVGRYLTEQFVKFRSLHGHCRRLFVLNVKQYSNPVVFSPSSVSVVITVTSRSFYYLLLPWLPSLYLPFILRLVGILFT